MTFLFKTYEGHELQAITLKTPLADRLRFSCFEEVMSGIIEMNGKWSWNAVSRSDDRIAERIIYRLQDFNRSRDFDDDLSGRQMKMKHCYINILIIIMY